MDCDANLLAMYMRYIDNYDRLSFYPVAQINLTVFLLFPPTNYAIFEDSKEF